MSNDDIAAAVLECVGGFGNVLDNSLCATRLRIKLRNPGSVNRNALHSIKGVLGIADRGTTGIEVVFGPNLVRGVFRSFERLTGIFEGPHDDDDGKALRPTANFQVKITPETPGAPEVYATTDRAAVTELTTPLDDDTTALLEMLDDTLPGQGDARDAEESRAPLDPPADDATQDDVDATAAHNAFDEHDHPSLLVINGPNVNMLGMGAWLKGVGQDYASLLELCRTSALEAGFVSCECYQSNHEGDLVDHIQDALGAVDAIVINPSALAYTSLSLPDALRAVDIPAVEVHMGKTDEHESHRSISHVADACLETIQGLGIEGYRKAIFDLAHHLAL